MRRLAVLFLALALAAPARAAREPIATQDWLLVGLLHRHPMTEADATQRVAGAVVLCRQEVQFTRRAWLRFDAYLALTVPQFSARAIGTRHDLSESAGCLARRGVVARPLR